MHYTPILGSTAIAALEYRRFAPDTLVPSAPAATGFLLVTFRHGGRRAYCVGSHVVGLLMAARANGRSVGKMFNKIVRGAPSVRMEG